MRFEPTNAPSDLIHATNAKLHKPVTSRKGVGARLSKPFPVGLTYDARVVADRELEEEAACFIRLMCRYLKCRAEIQTFKRRYTLPRS